MSAATTLYVVMMHAGPEKAIQLISIQQGVVGKKKQTNKQTKEKQKGEEEQSVTYDIVLD